MKKIHPLALSRLSSHTVVSLSSFDLINETDLDKFHGVE